MGPEFDRLLTPFAFIPGAGATEDVAVFETWDNRCEFGVRLWSVGRVVGVVVEPERAPVV